MAVESRTITRVGDPVPDITLPSLDGTPVNLRDFLSRKLVIFCWASW